MPHDAFSFELLLALSRTPQTAETIRRKLSERGVRAPLRSIQTKLERLAEYPRYPIVIDRSSAPFTYAWRERAPAVTVPGEDEAHSFRPSRGPSPRSVSRFTATPCRSSAESSVSR